MVNSAPTISLLFSVAFSVSSVPLWYSCVPGEIVMPVYARCAITGAAAARRVCRLNVEP